jgi:hypothetical protein
MNQEILIPIVILYGIASILMFVYWSFEEWHAISLRKMYENHGVAGWIIYEALLFIAVPIIIIPLELITLIVKFVIIFGKSIKRVFYEIFEYRVPYIMGEIKSLLKE